MKFFVVALSLAVICSVSAVTDEQREAAEKVAKECAAASGLAPADVQKLRSDPKNSAKDPKAQKFGKCFLGRIGFIDDKGEFQEAVAIEKLSKGEDRARIEDIVKQCKAASGDNKDEAPIRLYACYIEKKALKA